MTKQEIITAICALDTDASATALDKAHTKRELSGMLKALQAEKPEVVDFVSPLKEASQLQDKAGELYEGVIEDLKAQEIKWDDISDYLRDNHLRVTEATNKAGEVIKTGWPEKTLKDGTVKLVGIGQAKEQFHFGAIWLQRFNTYRSTHYSGYGIARKKKDAILPNGEETKDKVGATRNEVATDNKTTEGKRFNREQLVDAFAFMQIAIQETAKEDEKDLLEDAVQDLKAFFKVKA